MDEPLGSILRSKYWTLRRKGEKIDHLFYDRDSISTQKYAWFGKLLCTQETAYYETFGEHNRESLHIEEYIELPSFEGNPLTVKSYGRERTVYRDEVRLCEVCARVEVMLRLGE